MRKGRLRLLKTLPGPQNDAAILAEFCSQGDGLIAALDSKHLSALRHEVPSDYDSDVELLDFGFMVAAYAHQAGTKPRSLVGAQQGMAAVGEVCERLEADSPFYGCRNFKGLHRRLVETIRELGNWGFESDTLADLAIECGPDLRSKLESLSFIWKQAEMLLNEFRFEFGYQHIAHCLNSKPNEDTPFPRCLIFLNGEVAPKHLEWIRWAVSVGGQLTVVVETSTNNADLFPALKVVEQHLQLEAEQRGSTSDFASSLFTSEVAADPGIRVERFQASDPLAEVEWALRRCLQEVQEDDYNRTGIFVRNLQEYGPLIQAAAERLKVNIQISWRAPLASNGYIRTLLIVLDALFSGDVRRLHNLVRSSYFRFPHAVRKEFLQAITEAYRDSGKAWEKIELWAESQEEELNWLPKLLEWRKEAVAKPVTLGAWRERLHTLGNEIVVQGNTLPEGRDVNARNALENILRARATFLEKTELRFTEALHEVLSVVKESEYTLPSEKTGVQISDSPNGFAVVDNLFVLGMLEGVFPRRRSESPILTDADRTEISERGKLMFPLVDSFAIAREERDAFVALCSVPAKSIVFSYPETTDDRDNIEAFYLEEVRRALGGLPHHVYSRSLLAPPIEECIAESDKALRQALDSPEARPSEPPDLSVAMRETLQAQAPERLEPRELRTALECPFRHFAQGTLNLYPDRDRRRWYQLRQLPQETHLINQPDPETATRVLRQQLASELEELRPHVPESEWQLLKQGGERLIQDWVRREFRARRLWPKDEGTIQPNVQFGSETLRDELPRVGKLEGRIAGTSRMGPYKVIHMVESSTPTNDRTSILGLKDRDALYYGLHLMAGFEKGVAMALEVESMSGRKLMLLPRQDEPTLVGEVESGLEVTDLAEKGEAPVTREVFFERVKDLLGQATKSIREVDVHTTNGDHCSFCDYGELCRRSSEFGEIDSPFDAEEEL